MYSTKDQAGIYLDRINAKAKSVSTVLLITLPLIILLLMEMQRNYHFVSVYIAGQESNFKLTDAKKTAVDSITLYNRQIGRFYEKLPQSIQHLKDTTKAEAIKEFVKNIEEKKNKQRQKLRSYNSAKRIHNDSLVSKLSALRIPLELPLLKNTTYFSIKTVVLIVMLMLCGLLFYLYSAKLFVLRLLKKFVNLNPIEPVVDSEDISADMQLKLPLWLLPLNDNIFNKGVTYKISNLMGVSKKHFLFCNVGMVLLLFVVLVLATILAWLNWDIHYKLYHKHYAWPIAWCFFLLFLSIIFIVKMLKTGFRNKEVIVMATSGSTVINRLQFIAMGAATVGCFLFEPVYGRLKKGDKWFHIPRFKQGKIPNPGILNALFYTNISKSKKRKHLVYYITSTKPHFLKYASNPDKFILNLKEISFDKILANRAYLVNLNEHALLNFLEKQRWEPKKKLSVLNKYLDAKIPESLQMIDVYSMLYKKVISVNRSENIIKHRKIIEKINEVKSNPDNYLPQKYLFLASDMSDADKQIFEKNKKDLHDQLLRRIAGWSNRFKIIQATLVV